MRALRRTMKTLEKITKNPADSNPTPRQNNRDDHKPVFPVAAMVNVDYTCNSALFVLDNSMWFGQVAFQTVLANLLKGASPEHLTTSPEDILDRVELLWQSTNEGSSTAGEPRVPVGRLLLDYVDSLWSRHNSLVEVQAYLDPLIKEAMEKARSEKLSELDAKSITADRLKQPQTVAVGQNRNSPLNVTVSPANGENESVSNASGDEIQAESGSQLEKHRYTSRLFEIGDEIGVTPEFQKIHISTLPSVWKSRLCFGEHVEEATARSSKVAKHEASYRLCTRIGIKID